MRVSICDDEKLFLEQIEEVLKGIPEITQIDSYDDIHKLWQYLESNTEYDIIFMDIEWKQLDKNGTHFASRINKLYPDVQIIYVTAYNDRFSETIFWEPVNLCGYLVKPIKYDKVMLLINKALCNIEKRKRERIVVQYKGITESIPLANIIYLESSAHQIFIYTVEDKISVYKKLDDYEKELKNTFVRIHKSFLVNMNYIKRIDGNKLMLIDGMVLPISKGKNQIAKDKFFRFMGEQL